MISAIQRLDDKSIKLTITIPASDIESTKAEVTESLSKLTNLPGFRKGKAPKKLVADQLNPEQIREEILRKLLPKYYIQAVEEHKIRPIVTPQVHVEKVEDPSASSGQVDWQFSALTCEMPEIALNKYKDKVKKVTAKSKDKTSFDEIVKVLLEETKVAVPALLVNQEVERLLARLLDDIKKLGLNLDQYLASTNRTPENLRTEYEQKAKNDIQLEFVLQQIAEDEKLSVEEKEIDEAIQKAKSEDEKKSLESNRHLLGSILRQQKTLDFLRNL